MSCFVVFSGRLEEKMFKDAFFVAETKTCEKETMAISSLPQLPYLIPSITWKLFLLFSWPTNNQQLPTLPAILVYQRLSCRTTLKRRPWPFKDGLGLGFQGLWMVLIPTKVSEKYDISDMYYVHDNIEQYTYHNLSIHMWDIWSIYYKCLILQIVWFNVPILNDVPPPKNCHHAGCCIFGAGSLLLILTFTFRSYW